jgi:hypothetical protein
MSRAATLLPFTFFILVCTLSFGCAAPGDPIARHPITPVAITDLAAHQSGSAVILTFSLPRQSTDRQPLAETPALEIYRAELSPGETPDRKTPWRLVYTVPPEQVGTYLKGDRIEFRDPLTQADLAHPGGSPFVYMVRTRAVKERASSDSNVIAIPIYFPPDAPRDLQIAVTETSIDLSWTAPFGQGATAKPAGFRVYRAEVESPPSDTQNSARIEFKSSPVLLGQTTATEFQDTHIEFGRMYIYFVRAVVQYGENFAESDDSVMSTASVTPEDTFPPAAPMGLEVAIVPATPQTPTYIELSWAISPEGDLAGYHVYRSTRDDTLGPRINTALLPSPTFRDISVQSGERYFYRVSAVDRAGNESPLSSQVQAVVP